MHISPAHKEDIPALVKLLNGAYRGEGSKQGWTTEADMVAGDLRTDEANMNELMQMPGAIFLKYSNERNEIEGCVFLHKRQGKLYLGMLSVSPALQTKGIGKQIMAAAELYARSQGCRAVFMRVISIRHELMAWYERQGYYKTGEIQPFDDTKFGTAKQPIEFVVLQKDL
ncbi:MAG TPA: GNAT family N-acetyltransferase [Chitinophagaceae bacterium]|nr:GNAT family N-acetyltransferase [Chitinophagaceae bacterium]